MAAATKSLDISGKKPGASLPTKEHVDLPERVDVNIDELAGSEESDEAESTGVSLVYHTPLNQTNKSTGRE
jgi:hypothetical protein